MTISYAYYGTVIGATDYFAMRFNEYAWTQSLAIDRPKALLAATRIIDTLNFKGNKHTVHELLSNAGCCCDVGSALDANCVTKEEVQAANLAQELEFPRGSDTDVPSVIEQACYEFSHSLLDGKDPELELENLAVATNRYASVRTTYNRAQVPIEHLVNLVPNALAWRWLKPFIRDEDAVKITRIS
jgi:hypothetical protein